MNKIIVIVGPTGVGKTRLSLALAKQYDGEIISADSMQVYKHLNIATAKIKDQENIVHHLIDIKQLNENYTVYDFQKDARNKIKEIQTKNKTPIIVGGTGLYIKACLYDYNFKEEKNNKIYDEQSTDELYSLLIKIDPQTEIHPNNKKRIIRALNYFYNNNKPISENFKSENLLYDSIIIGLTDERQKIYETINNRVDQMFAEGLLEEAKDLYNQKIFTKPITSGIGYKELYQYFNNEITLEEAKNNIKQNSRKYAKRQYTFFKNQLDVKWFNIKEDFNKTIEEIKEHIKTVS